MEKRIYFFKKIYGVFIACNLNLCTQIPNQLIRGCYCSTVKVPGDNIRILRYNEELISDLLISLIIIQM